MQEILCTFCTFTMPSPKFRSNCGTPWLDFPAYKKCCSCSWKPSGAPMIKGPRSRSLITTPRRQRWWHTTTSKKMTIQADEETNFATRISQAVKNEKLDEETKMEAKRER